MRLLFLIWLSLMYLKPGAQTLGGDAVFNFLKLSNTPQLSALGGVNISQPSADVGLVFHNPALLTPAMHTQVNAVFNSFYSGIQVYHLSGGYHHSALKTNFSWGLNYFNYGEAPETDASGNILGSFRPVDWVMQLSASRQYREKWNYGASVKFIQSSYGQFRSNGMAMDVGVLYKDTANLFTASVVVKNAGTQLKKYPGAGTEELPFDLQAGITKRLKNAPLSFSVTAQRLHRFDISYNDTDFNNENGWSAVSDKKITFDKIFRHFVFATTVYIGNYVELMAGYNFLRRKELNIGDGGNGVNGFSVGAGALFGKLQVRYARAYYQSSTAYNQFGLNLQLNKYFGPGKPGQKAGR